MKKIFLFLLMLLVVSPCQATGINVKREATTPKGGMRMPSATQIAADYDDGVVTVDVSRYTGTVQLYVYDANNTVVNYAVATISGSGTVTMSVDNIPEGDYKLCIVLDDATYGGQFRTI
ncbi:DUF3244 domain-containing protein [Prevotella sp.]|uniref:DUF3244 domain-containing protein n=1 Tax=uncultured Prevotella sp. TaxID=159272 RepID=UPI00258B3A90|nr:DUF3244 domain-containing protein [Prevotella sp.]MDD6853206.1 DUF3244 domain-containing protein [Prevotella sp.]MDY6266247.1 DUF3244 domain-containing protein [Prevotella sp.]